MFTAYVWGRNVYIITKQDLMEAIYTDHNDRLSLTPVRTYLFVNIFGAPRPSIEASLPGLEDALCCLKKHTQGKGLSRLLTRLTQEIQEETPNLLSFSESVVDENTWERLSNPKIIVGNPSTEVERTSPVVEVDMFALIRNFVGLLTLRSMMGSDWADSQPTFVDMLWSFDEGWRSMLMGLPRWLPIPGIAKAYIARRSLSTSLESFHRAMDKHINGEISPSTTYDLDEVSQLFKDRCDLWKEHGTAGSVKAAADLSLLWA